jgi:RNA polymerase sigma-70 factor (ECF subfamily)
MCNDAAGRYTSSMKKGLRYADPVPTHPESATDESDADLAGRVQDGDRAAEAELFRRLAPRVRLYGLRHLRDSAAADDLVQDVMLLTFDSLRAGKVRERERLASFVLGTCRRVVIDIRRGAARRDRLLEHFGPGLAPAAAASDAAAPLDLERLGHCLQRLAERERAVVVLSFYSERGSDEIAAELGLSPGNVRVVRHRALTRLRDCMGAAA